MTPREKRLSILDALLGLLHSAEVEAEAKKEKIRADLDSNKLAHNLVSDTLQRKGRLNGVAKHRRLNREPNK